MNIIEFEKLLSEINEINGNVLIQQISDQFSTTTNTLFAEIDYSESYTSYDYLRLLTILKATDFNLNEFKEISLSIRILAYIGDKENLETLFEKINFKSLTNIQCFSITKDLARSMKNFGEYEKALFHYKRLLDFSKELKLTAYCFTLIANFQNDFYLRSGLNYSLRKIAHDRIFSDFKEEPKNKKNYIVKESYFNAENSEEIRMQMLPSIERSSYVSSRFQFHLLEKKIRSQKKQNTPTSDLIKYIQLAEEMLERNNYKAYSERVVNLAEFINMRYSKIQLVISSSLQNFNQNLETHLNSVIKFSKRRRDYKLLGRAHREFIRNIIVKEDEPEVKLLMKHYEELKNALWKSDIILKPIYIIESIIILTRFFNNRQFYSYAFQLNKDLYDLNDLLLKSLIADNNEFLKKKNDINTKNGLYKQLNTLLTVNERNTIRENFILDYQVLSNKAMNIGREFYRLTQWNNINLSGNTLLQFLEFNAHDVKREVNILKNEFENYSISNSTIQKSFQALNDLTRHKYKIADSVKSKINPHIILQRKYTLLYSLGENKISDLKNNFHNSQRVIFNEILLIMIFRNLIMNIVDNSESLTIHIEFSGFVEDNIFYLQVTDNINKGEEFTSVLNKINNTKNFKNHKSHGLYHIRNSIQLFSKFENFNYQLLLNEDKTKSLIFPLAYISNE